MSHFVARWLKVSLVVIVGCGFLAMMIYAFVNKDEIQSSQIEPPLIAAPAEPLKRRPDQPGGMQIPNRDKLVFDLLDSSNTTLGETGIGSGQTVSDTASLSSPTASVASESIATSKAVELSATADAPIKEPVIPVQTAAMAPSIISTPTAIVAMPAEPKVIPAASKKIEDKKIVTLEPKPVEKVSGKWGVQLAAVNSVADGNAMASKAAKDFAALRTLASRIIPAPGGKKYRVQFVGLKDRDSAAGVCAKLAGKQACFPVSVQ